MRNVFSLFTVYISYFNARLAKMEPMEIEESLVLITLNSQSIRNAMETKLEDKFCPEQMQILLNQFTTNVSSYERLRQEGNTKNLE